MLSIRKTYFWILLYMLIIQMLAPKGFKPSDELGVMMMLALIGLDMMINHQLSRYKSLGLMVGIVLLYAIYSIVFLDFNTPGAICTDFILQLKPFVPFYISYAIAPTLRESEKKIIRGTCLAMTPILLFTELADCTKELFAHVSYMGSMSFICFLFYTFCSINKDGNIPKRNIYIALIILAVGLLCTRSKYYGEAVLAMYLLFLYKPGFTKHIKLSHVLISIFSIIIFIGVIWSKVEYYFITGGEAEFTPETMETFARPALYVGMFMILLDFPLLGSGLASYATFASSPDVNYSGVYALYDLDKVWGLSEQMYDFICDAHFASLAQFGLIGIGLFIYFFYWIGQKLRLVLHIEGKYHFAIGVLAIAYCLIESSTGANFVQSGGLIVMMLLGLIAGKYRNTSKEQKKEILNLEYKTN